MKRIGIFCLYTPTGEIDSSITNTLKDLREVVTYLIIVVNGQIKKKFELNRYADKVLIRKNVGLDVGAYTDVILSLDYIDMIKNSDELVLCNSSFYGPFISFIKIFERMKKSTADFWGISSSEKNFVQHIQSYFLVFRHNVLRRQELFCYLRERVDKKSLDYYDACSIFENGLFSTLKNAGYQFDAYKRNIDCDNYLNPYGSVKIDRLPILKRKVFSKEFFQNNKVINALCYIKETYHYDITPILDNAYCTYGVRLLNEAIRRDLKYIAEKDLFQESNMIDREEVENFILHQKKVFIYGNGIMAKMVYSCFFFYEGNPYLEGFVVSDNQSIAKRDFRGYPLYKYSEIKNKCNIAILIALNRDNTKEVVPQLKEIENIKLLWRS